MCSKRGEGPYIWRPTTEGKSELKRRLGWLGHKPVKIYRSILWTDEL